MIMIRQKRETETERQRERLDNTDEREVEKL